MRRLLLSVGSCCVAGGLIACGGNASYSLSPSELSGQLAGLYAEQLSKKEIEYCGPAYVLGSMRKSKIDDLSDYSQLPRKVKKSVDRWVGAHNLKTGKKIALSSFAGKADSQLVNFLNGESSSSMGVNEKLLMKCETVGLNLQFDAVSKAVEAEK